MKTNPNDTASPVHGGYQNDDPRNMILGGGLTKREHFAAVAMQGMLLTGGMTAHGVITQAPTDIAQLAVWQADALIEALNRDL